MRTKGTYSQTKRINLLLDTLRTRKTGVAEVDLGKQFGVSRNQIDRDVDEMETHGHVLKRWIGEDNKKFVRLVAEKTKSIEITRRERYSLLALAGMLGPLKDTFLHEDIESVCMKLLSRLPPDERAEAESLSEMFIHIPDGGVKSYRGMRDIQDDLLTGIMYRRFVRYGYRTASGREEKGVIAPYAMAPYRNELYVLAARVDESTLGTNRVVIAEPGLFAVERFRAAKFVAKARFERPKGLRELFDDAFGIHIGKKKDPRRVVVEFSKEIRQRVTERVYHSSQQVEPLPDRGVRLAFELRELTELPSWVLMFGKHARVCEPPELVDELRSELVGALKRYPIVPMSAERRSVEGAA